jgi:hypothetical protein
MTSTRTAGEWNRRNNFLNHLKKLLNQFYSIQDKNSVEHHSMNAEIKGFLDAGLIARVSTEKDLQKFIDLQRYGVTAKPSPRARVIKEDNSKKSSEVYEEPTYQRNGPRATAGIFHGEVPKTDRGS